MDSFRSLIGDSCLLGKAAGNHALGDIFVMGAKPQIESTEPKAASCAQTTTMGHFSGAANAYVSLGRPRLGAIAGFCRSGRLL